MKTKNSFSCWVKWDKRIGLKNKDLPGVYVIAISSTNLSGRKFSWLRKVRYIGMTKSRGGLHSRLGQFNSSIKTIRCKSHHGGAERFLYKYNTKKKLENLKRDLYVSICPFMCDVNSNTVKDLLIMGKVAEFEYVCFSKYSKKFGRLPWFNDKKRSPKH